MPLETDSENDHRKTTFQKAKEVEAAMVEVSAVAASVGEKAARAVVAKAARKETVSPAEAEVQRRKEVQFGDSLMHGRRRKSALPTS